MPRLLLASNNRGKWREIIDLLQDLEVDLRTPADLDIKLQVVEDGHTYAENAARR